MAVFYSFVVWPVIQAFGSGQVVGAATGDIGGLFFTAIGTCVGSWGATVMHLFVISSVYAGQLAFHNAITATPTPSLRTGSCPRGSGRSIPGTARPTARASCRPCSRSS